jgi:flagellar biosynthetic protein FliR
MTDLYGLGTARLETYFLIAIRVGFMLSLVPVLSARQIPPLIRIGIMLILTFLIAKLVPVVHALSLGQLVLAVMEQALVGLMYGFVSFLVFTGIQFAGEILDIQIGYGVVNVINPQTQQQVTIIGEFELAFATLVYLITNSHHYLIAGMVGSFNLLPMPDIALNAVALSDVVRFFTQSLFIVFQIAAPVAAALFLVNVALALMARVAPQMNIFAVGFPLQIMVGLLMIIVSFPLLGTVLPQIFSEVPPQLDTVMRALMPAK